MKKQILGLGLALFILLGGIYIRQSAAVQSFNQNPSSSVRVLQKIELGQQNKFYEYTVQSRTTALDLLNKTTRPEIQGQGTGAYVVAINNIKASVQKKQYWAFFVNGKLSEVGAGSYFIKPGDKIEWKIQTY